MNHKEKLLEVYEISLIVDDIEGIPLKYRSYINEIGERVFSQKGVYTVLVTLITHKILHPEQDIRYHQNSMKGGFSGRTIDTQYITPTLKELGLPSMAESGWLTRSLEQPYPYRLDYNGKISDKKVKEAFLNILDFIEKRPKESKDVLRLLLNKVFEVNNISRIEIIPLENPEKLTIHNIIECLDIHFSYDYGTAGGSKLPVLAFYAIYKSLINELKRYEDCSLVSLGSHTASDRTSKTAGDIEIYKNDELFEVIEIKLDKEIDQTIVRIAFEKIIRYNPRRYYIFSHKNIKLSEKEEIINIIRDVKEKHGCQIILNGIVPSLKYYLRLVSSLEDFVNAYSIFIQEDTELKRIHKQKWNEIIEEMLN